LPTEEQRAPGIELRIRRVIQITFDVVGSEPNIPARHHAVRAEESRRVDVTSNIKIRIGPSPAR